MEKHKPLPLRSFIREIQLAKSEEVIGAQHDGNISVQMVIKNGTTAVNNCDFVLHFESVVRNHNCSIEIFLSSSERKVSIFVKSPSAGKNESTIKTFVSF